MQLRRLRRAMHHLWVPRNIRRILLRRVYAARKGPRWLPKDCQSRRKPDGSVLRAPSSRVQERLISSFRIVSLSCFGNSYVAVLLMYSPDILVHIMYNTKPSLTFLPECYKNYHQQPEISAP